MYLKAIELENFKSFGRKTKLEFKEGFTAISGPNGSGKSNITDAILFVLGPKSSKKIRAQRLTDLIYNGGKNGKPADYCRVSLIFDNRDRILPLDEDEVKLTRYIKRANNEEGFNSYFYINDERARLQDFNSILIHAKISADGYNFVQQGDVTRIVEMTPLERRTILDDIAGITKFDNEIKKAEDKKKITEENMGRIEVLLDEIRRRIEALEKDREVALRYKELEEKFKETQAKIAYAKMKNAETRRESYKKQLDSIEDEMKKLRNLIQEKNKEKEEVERKISEVDRKIEEMGEGEIAKMRKEIDDLKIRAAEIKMNIENDEDRIKEYEEEIKTLKESLKEINKEIKEKESEFKSLEKEKEKIEKEYREKLSLQREKDRSIGEANEKFRKLREEHSKILDKLDKKRKEYSSKTMEENRIIGEIERIKGEIASREEDRKDIEAAIKDAEWRISQFKSEGKSYEKRRKELEKKLYELKSEESRLSKELKNKENEIIELRAEYERIKARMESSEDAMSRAVMAVLAARDRGELHGIYGTIAELGNVDEKYALAIEIAGGNRMMSIVCEDDESAAKAIEYLKKNRIGRAIFLPLNKMLRGRPRGKAILASRDPHALGFAIDLIRFDKKFEAAFWYVFGDTVIMDNLDNARRLMGGVRLVTLDGQLIEASGAMVGGVVERRKKISMGNLDEIGAKLRRAREDKEKIQGELDQVRAQIDKILEETRNLSVKDNSSQIEVWVKEKKRNQEKLKSLKEQIENLERDRERYNKLLDTVRKEKGEIKKEIENLEKEEGRIRDDMDKLIPENISKEMEVLKREVSELAENLKEVEKEIVKVDESLKNLRDRKEEMEKELQSKLAERDRFNDELKKLRKEQEEVILKKRKLEEIVKKEEGKIGALIKERDRLSSIRDKISSEIEKANTDLRVKDGLKIHVISNMKEEENKYMEAKREYESYGIDVKKIEPLSKLKSILDEVQSEMLSLGPVNMKSIEEYDQERERYEELRKEYTKLNDEKKNLMKLVRELNEKKKDGLMKVFNAINENFKKIYNEISNGGEAELLLENPDDPFKGGLIIKVKPVGKKFIRLESLSGGEKSLTALAFIFAIQQYDPSPFYVLDEVDMFLDGINAEMVGRIIKRNSRTAQFIVISLRKATLKFADYVIGVTQQGDGLSKVFLQKVPGEVNDGAA